MEQKLHKNAAKALSTQQNVGSFLPEKVWTNKNAEKQRKKMKRTPKKKKPHTLLKCVSVALAGGLIGYMTYINLLARAYNDTLPSRDPHTAEDVFDPNGNDFEFGDDSQIITDTMDESEIKVLTENFINNISEDARNRCETEVGQISEILACALIPCNMIEGANEIDKYRLSILFKNENENLFELQYFTGTDFESDAETSKDYFADFINYLYYNCSILSCVDITDNLALFDGCVDETVTAVGQAFWGYKESGDEYYYIPVYTSAGEGTVYYTISSTIDGYEKDPVEELRRHLLNIKDDNSDKIAFSYMPFTKSSNIQKAMKILSEKLLKENENETENKL